MVWLLNTNRIVNICQGPREIDLVLNNKVKGSVGKEYVKMFKKKMQKKREYSRIGYKMVMVWCGYYTNRTAKIFLGLRVLDN
jgi:hypothetical protein